MVSHILAASSGGGGDGDDGARDGIASSRGGSRSEADACTSDGSASPRPAAAHATAALVAVLKVAKQLQLLTDLDRLPSGSDAAAGAGSSAAPGGGAGGATAAAMRQLLLAAVSSGSASLRIDTLELACVGTRCGLAGCVSVGGWVRGGGGGEWSVEAFYSPLRGYPSINPTSRQGSSCRSVHTTTWPSRRPTEAPGDTELALASRYLQLSMRCTAAEVRGRRCSCTPAARAASQPQPCALSRAPPHMCNATAGCWLKHVCHKIRPTPSCAGS